MHKNRKETHILPEKKGMTNFQKAFIWTVIPVVALSFIGAVITLVQPKNSVLSRWFLVAGLVVWCLAIPVFIGFAVAKRRQIELGILTGIVIGLVGLTVSLFIGYVIAKMIEAGLITG
jgi:hypothetical protein